MNSTIYMNLFNKSFSLKYNLICIWSSSLRIRCSPLGKFIAVKFKVPYLWAKISTSQLFLLTVITLPIITWPISGLYDVLEGITVTSFDIVLTFPNNDDNISPFIS